MNPLSAPLLVFVSVFLLAGASRAEEHTPVNPAEVQRWRKAYVVNAWCRDFLLGSEAGDKPNKDGRTAHELWVQMAGERGAHRILPAVYPDGKTSTRDCSSWPDDGLVSPDARRVALTQKHCTAYSVAYVLQRDDQSGFMPLPKLLSEMGWDRFLEDHPGFFKSSERMDGITGGDGSSLCDLVAWEAGGSRLWLSLRGGNRQAKGIYQWYFAWEPVTGMAVVPEEVRLINRFAEERWTSQVGELSADRAKAEEEHYRFLAGLAHRIGQAGAAPADPAALGQEWLRKRKDPGVADRASRNAGSSPAGIARQVIAEQLEVTFQASLRLGAVAPGEQETH